MNKLNRPCSYFTELVTLSCGQGSSVGKATDYGLDGPGSNPGGDDIFRLGPTQLPLQWVPGLSLAANASGVCC